MKKRGKKLRWDIIVIGLIFISTLGLFVYYNYFSAKEINPVSTTSFQLSEDDSEKNITETEEYKNFKSSCEENNGETAYYELEESIVLECYAVLEDDSESCRNDLDCESKNCNLAYAISSGSCILSNTYKDLAQGTYTYVYECSEDNPGRCSSIPDFSEIDFEMQGNLLIEQGEGDFPQEESEFAPV